MKDISFKVIRIRCWKTNQTKEETSISIEYLIKKDQLEWITIHTEHAALISTSLQSMVDEILTNKSETTNSTTTTEAKTTEQATSGKGSNGLAKRTKAIDYNDIFDKHENDDDL